MKLGRFLTILSLSLLLLLNVWTNPSFAQNTTQGQVQVLQRKTILDFNEELKLTGAQEEKIKKVIDGFERRTREFQWRMAKLDEELRKLLEEEGDIKEIEKRVNEIFNLRARLVVEEIKAGREIDKVLNEEQRKKWKDIRRGGRP